MLFRSADEAGLARVASAALAALERSADDAEARADLAQALEAVAAEPAPLAPTPAPAPAPPDDDEDIEARPFSPDEIKQMLAAEDIIDLKTVAGLALLTERGRG